MRLGRAILSGQALLEFMQAVHTKQPVAGLTHGFYRYPARFSPLFAKAAISLFTKPGDIVLDPFMGSGTSLVEARILGRRAIGVDINELAVFLARVKTALYSANDVYAILQWGLRLGSHLSLRHPSIRPESWIESGYQKNIDGRELWPIRKLLELALARVPDLRTRRQQEFARCVLLKTGQWALDCRDEIPSADEFRNQFFSNLLEMCEGAEQFSAKARTADRAAIVKGPFRTLYLNRSALGLEAEKRIMNGRPPRLILTSPPYPGVHVLYHRWQIRGRKETPAPYWISDCMDSEGPSFYTLGYRREPTLKSYYEQISRVFLSLAKIVDKETLLVQILAFSEPSWQLPKYLKAMEEAGFRELKFPLLKGQEDSRLWRSVPNRKWYAGNKGLISSSKEVVLFHQLAQF